MAKKTVIDRIRKFMNPTIKGKFTQSLLEALAEGDSFNDDNVLAVKENLFVATASEIYLDKLMAGIGFTRPPGVGIDDDLFREIGIKQTNNKLVTNIFLDVLEVFYGIDAVRSNVLSSNPQGYPLTDGMVLYIKVDKNPVPLTVIFKAEDFEDISMATAQEVASVISRYSFNANYTLTAEVEEDAETGLKYVRLISGTKGPNSSITVVGGDAQNVLKFPQVKDAVAKIGTQFSMSISGPYVRFTWSAGPSPGLSYVDPGDYVNIYGSGFSLTNRGTYTIENVQDGPLGQAYFEITNPNFAAQGPVTVNGIDAISGGGTVSRTVNIALSPTGAVRSSGTVTITTSAAHGLLAGQQVKITGVDNSTFNGTFTLLTAGGSTFTYSQAGANAASGGGLVTVSSTIQAIPSGAVRLSGTTTIQTISNHNLSVGQFVSIQGVGDSSFNGSFTVATTPTATSFTYAQDQSNDVTFFSPKKSVVQQLPRYASVYEVNPYEIVAFLPATTRIVKRSLVGAWHIHDSALDKTYQGSYVFSPSSGFPISSTSTTLAEAIEAGELKTVGFGTNTSQFPDQEGFLVIDFGTSNQEGPIRYLGRPSSGSWLLDPSYKFKLSHDVGADVTLIADRKPYTPKTDGTDYQAYLTNTIAGRTEAQKLIEGLAAAGVFLNVIIVYPKGKGLHDIEGYVYAGDPE